MHRLLVPLPEPLPPTLQVEGEAFHHLVRVLRASVGETVELFDGAGRTSIAEVLAVGADAAQLRPGPLVHHLQAPGPWVLHGLPKGERWDWALQKGTELGAGAFLPVLSARTIVRLDPAEIPRRQARWQKIVAESARQNGRADVPPVFPAQSLSEALAALPPGMRLCVLDEEERTVRLPQILTAESARLPLAIAVGPEGGWERDEIAQMKRLGGIAASLGTQVLRTETAPLFVLSALRFLTL